MPKSHQYTCSKCGHRWIGENPRCPAGCDTIVKSEGEFTHKTFQGSDTDLKKSGR